MRHTSSTSTVCQYINRCNYSITLEADTLLNKNLTLDEDGNPYDEENVEDAYEENWYPEVPEGEPDPVKCGEGSLVVLHINRPQSLWYFKQDENIAEEVLAIHS